MSEQKMPEQEIAEQERVEQECPEAQAEAEAVAMLSDASLESTMVAMPVGPAAGDEQAEPVARSARPDAGMPLDDDKVRQIVEGALLAAGSTLDIERLGFLFDEADRPTAEQFRSHLQQLQTFYAARGIELKEVASGWRFQVRHELGYWVSRLWEEKPARYSRALLETLALIAYRQPITRSEIEEIRGVAVSTNIVKTLMEREWIRVVGYRDVPGRPAMFATTRQFLDSFNLASLDELPSLAEIRDLDKLNEELELRDVSAQALSLTEVTLTEVALMDETVLADDLMPEAAVESAEEIAESIAVEPLDAGLQLDAFCDAVAINEQPKDELLFDAPGMVDKPGSDEPGREDAPEIAEITRDEEFNDAYEPQ